MTASWMEGNESQSSERESNKYLLWLVVGGSGVVVN